jgi:hypothetical protein
MTIASGNVINRENLLGVDYPFGVWFSRPVGYIHIDPEDDLLTTSFWVYEEAQAPPVKEKSRLKVKLPKGLYLYLFGVAVPRGVAPLSTNIFSANTAPIIYTPDPLTGDLKETGIGPLVPFSTPIPIAPMLLKIYDPLFPLNELSESKNAYPLPGFDAGAAVPLVENSYLKINTGTPIVLSPEALKAKKPLRIAIVVAGWKKDVLSVSVGDIGGWSTNDY